jgi:replicative DNA helicase
VDTHALRTGNLTAEQAKDVIHASGKLKCPLLIDDWPGQSMARIMGQARLLRRRKKIRLMILDYLQIVYPEDRKANRYEQIGATTRSLQYLSRELKIPIVALAQLGRDAEDRKPRLSDLRESGNIEQDADVVMTLHRPVVQDESCADKNEIIEVDVLKNRNGRTGSMKLIFNKPIVRFENEGKGPFAP